MKKKYTAKGTYNAGEGEPKKFEIEYENLVENEENNEKIGELLDGDPLDIIREGRQFGIKGIKRFILILFLFGFSNMILFFYAVSRFLGHLDELNKVVYVLLVAALGLGTTAYALYRAYGFVLIDSIRVIYENVRSYFKRIAEIIIDYAERTLKGKVEVTDKELAKALDFSKMIDNSLDKVPWVIRRGILFILRKLPIVGILFDMKEDILAGNKADASTKLYDKIDALISELFAQNNTKWVWWLWPLNIIVLLGIIWRNLG